MIEMNSAAFGQYLNVFDSELCQNSLAKTNVSMTKSTGNTIRDFNDCMSKYASFQTNLNRLCSSTSNYLHKVQTNVNLCEESNSVN